MIAGMPLLAMGGPVSGETPRFLEELPGLYSGGGTVVSAATEAQFRQMAPHYRVLQVTAHGVLNSTNPLYSQLQFAGAARPRSADEDGVMEAWEILRMPLGADLAVLSACESGRGRITRGEGVIGLSWAFFVAGVPTVVVSQWKVAESLRNGALELTRGVEYRHPFYWAGFIAIGR